MDPQRFCKLTRLVHLRDDVAASDEGAVDVELGDRGPVRERLDRLADLRVCQHIDGVKRHAIVCKRSDNCGREAALRTRRAAFHKENDGVELDGLGDTRLRITDVDDVRHKSVSRHASAEFVDMHTYAPNWAHMHVCQWMPIDAALTPRPARDA